MIPLDKAIEMMAQVKGELRSASAIVSPVVLSEQMMRLALYTGIIDEYLAECEQEYDVELAKKIKTHINEGLKVSPAETKAKMDLAEIRGQIDYLSRISGSAWKQVGVIQSRINHLRTESQTNI